MPINDSTLVDEDGAYSDWIEIHNPAASQIDLDGWSLTDDVDDLNLWTFPDVSIASGDYLVVFASDKNRTVPVAGIADRYFDWQKKRQSPTAS